MAEETVLYGVKLELPGETGIDFTCRHAVVGRGTCPQGAVKAEAGHRVRTPASMRIVRIHRPMLVPL